MHGSWIPQINRWALSLPIGILMSGLVMCVGHAGVKAMYLYQKKIGCSLCFECLFLISYLYHIKYHLENGLKNKKKDMGLCFKGPWYLPCLLQISVISSIFNDDTLHIK